MGWLTLDVAGWSLPAARSPGLLAVLVHRGLEADMPFLVIYLFFKVFCPMAIFRDLPDFSVFTARDRASRCHVLYISAEKHLIGWLPRAIDATETKVASLSSKKNLIFGGDR